MRILIFGIMTGIAFALGAMLNQAEPSVEVEPAISDAVNYETTDEAYPAPLPPSARGYPAPIDDPYPYPAPGPTATQWGVIIDCELWWVVCDPAYPTKEPLPTAAPTITPTRGYWGETPTPEAP